MEVDIIINGDCIEELKKLPENSINLIFADPPFNIGIKYDKYNDNLSYGEYMEFSEKWIDACLRVLKSNGSFYIAIGDVYAADIRVLMRKKEVYLRNWIIWYYTFGQAMQKKFSRAHTHILYFTKSEKKFIFNADAIRIPSQRQLQYNDKRANPTGKIPDDVWIFSRVCGTFKERVEKHPCQMPADLLERIILVSSNENDIVLDPFAGSGTTLVAAKKNNRRFIGIEYSENYYKIIKERLEETKNELIESKEIKSLQDFIKKEETIGIQT